MARQNEPGTVWKSHGAWHRKVKFPDETKRRDVDLTFPFSGKRIPADCAQSVAESAAFRLWDARVVKTRDDGRPIFTVNELCDRWVRFAETYYRHPDEACGLSWSRIERVGDVCAYRPEHHKNEWRRQVRRRFALG